MDLTTNDVSLLLNSSSQKGLGDSPPRYILVESRDSYEGLSSQPVHASTQTESSAEHLLRVELEEIRTLVRADRTLYQNY
jgi:hypothetical protein